MTTITPELREQARRELLKREAQRELQRREYARDPVKWAENHFYVEETVSQPAGLIQFMPHQRVILRYAFIRETTVSPSRLLSIPR